LQYTLAQPWQAQAVVEKLKCVFSSQQPAKQLVSCVVLLLLLLHLRLTWKGPISYSLSISMTLNLAAAAAEGKRKSDRTAVTSAAAP
jgi:hypothetical protein